MYLPLKVNGLNVKFLYQLSLKRYSRSGIFCALNKFFTIFSKVPCESRGLPATFVLYPPLPTWQYCGFFSIWKSRSRSKGSKKIVFMHSFYAFTCFMHQKNHAPRGCPAACRNANRVKIGQSGAMLDPFKHLSIPHVRSNEGGRGCPCRKFTKNQKSGFLSPFPKINHKNSIWPMVTAPKSNKTKCIF